MIIHKIEKNKLNFGGGLKVIAAEDYQNYLSAQQVRQVIKQEQQGAQVESNNLRTTSMQKGYLEGKQKAQEEMAQQQIEFIRAAIDYTQGLEKDIFASMESMLEKILGALDNKDIITALIKKVVKQYAHLPELKLIVAPTQEEQAKKEIALAARELNIKFISVEVDERLKEGDCILESPLGSVDASLSQQLSGIKKLIAQMPTQPLSIAPASLGEKDER